uniref:Uncharacterized protein n=1 Tax=Meloidogyne incognita TaxID=6306 RepID=A0A914MNM3_MELIC
MPEIYSLLQIYNNKTNQVSQKNRHYLKKELVGIVCYVKRGLTSKNKWNRTDILIQVGKPDELEKVAVFGWGAQAAVLEGAQLNNFIRLTNMIVVPEDIGKRETWNGTIEFKLKFTRSSTLTIIEQGQIAASQQNTNMIEEGPSTSAAIQNPHVGNVQNSSYASNATSDVDRDVEYVSPAPSPVVSDIEVVLDTQEQAVPAANQIISRPSRPTRAARGRRPLVSHSNRVYSHLQYLHDATRQVRRMTNGILNCSQTCILINKQFLKKIYKIFRK